MAAHTVQRLPVLYLDAYVATFLFPGLIAGPMPFLSRWVVNIDADVGRQGPSE